ncbi:FecR family protein [Carboxylicivirga linearis]|uniref:FecR domain-containing protein n=1 Tax=Carboxylicivirga linearis TaxID=1628157 RepID=A0ABS5JU36_9BACT|nr:FecR domain-containing protein [Carboxylicivirga linearis]MBS2097981.1 FecR domain-containing protein [Carboxylicivirga linearis]
MKQKRSHSIDWDLIAKDIAGELSQNEHDRLNNELSADNDLLGQLGELWGDAKYAQELKTIDTNKAWSKVQNDIHHKQRYRLMNGWKKGMLVAATVVIALGAYVLIKNLVSDDKFTSVIAQNEVTHIQLTDGTKVDLNIGSALKYPNVFDAETRKVELLGEAFFDVARNENQPFVIETNNLRIKVLGTSFNVKANVENGNEIVTVSSGKVEVWHNTSHVVLEKGEAVDFDVESKELVKTSVVNVNYKAWKTREIKFEDVSLREVIAIIESVYHITIEVDESVEVDSLILNAQFSHDNLEHVMRVVCQTFNLQSSREEDKYRIESVR